MPCKHLDDNKKQEAQLSHYSHISPCISTNQPNLKESRRRSPKEHSNLFEIRANSSGGGFLVFQ